jgi:hypothetical protein
MNSSVINLRELAVLTERNTAESNSNSAIAVGYDIAEDSEAEVEEETNASDQTDDNNDVTSDTQVEEDSNAQEQTENTAVEEEVSQPEGDTQTEPETSIDSETTESLDTSKKDSTDTKGDTPETKEFDYESAYKKVSEPFRANGIDIKVDDDDISKNGFNIGEELNILKGKVKNKKICFLGVTFKANTDDMRDSSCLSMIPSLVKKGAKINYFDPTGEKDNFKKIKNSKFMNHFFKVEEINKLYKN